MNPFWTVSLFWIAVVVCIAIALAFVLPPLLRTRTAQGKAARRDINIAVYRDQLKEMEADRANGLLSEAQFQSARLELEARLADDALGQDDTPAPGQVGSRRLGYGLAAVLPVAALGLYFSLGQPVSLISIAAPIAASQPGPAQSAMAGAPAEHDFMKLVQRVEAKTQANPDDGEAWAMLAKTYAALERWPEAMQAYGKATRLLPQDASVLSGFAEALAISNNRVLTGKPMELVRQALAIDPDDLKGLELAGIYAYQAGNYAQASAHFKRLHSLLPPESAYAQEILAAQQEAGHLAEPGVPQQASPASSPLTDNQAPTIAPGATIRGSIDIAPALKSRLVKTDVLFLFARSGPGGPPIAAMRASAGQLPLEYELDDSMAMVPGNALSQHKHVSLVARLSRSGNPMAQPGDFEGQIVDVAVGAKGVKLVIDRVLP